MPMEDQAHTGDAVWLDGNLTGTPRQYTAPAGGTVYYLTIACHTSRQDQADQVIYVEAKATRKTAAWVASQDWRPGQDVIIKGVITTPATTSLDGREENMKIRILNMATHTSRQDGHQ